MNSLPPDVPLVDVNVTWGQWPFRRTPGDEPAGLVQRLDKHRVRQAWIGSFEGVFHRDLRGVNDRLAATCQVHDAGRGDRRFLPFGSVNPRLPDWQEDLRRCHEVHGMPGVRLHPNYHGYALDLPELAELCDAAQDRQLIVQVVGSLEDERTQPDLARVPHVNLAPLAELARRRPQLAFVVLNAFRNTNVDQASKLAEAGRIYFDIAMLESVSGVRKLLDKVPRERVLFGTHFPLYYYESSVLKLVESALSGDELTAVAHGNATKVLTRS